MCTALAFSYADRFYFGRNLDLDASFGEQVVITPQNRPLSFRKSAPLPSHYAMIGMAAVIDNEPLYAEALNEKGLGAAGLHFPQSACYPTEADPNKENISPFELIPWLLGSCATLKEAKALLRKTQLLAIPFSDSVPLTPLHWFLADKTGSAVLEATAQGVTLYDDPVGILTNEPPFPFHLANLCHYRSLSARQDRKSLFPVEPFGLGLDACGLPGDYSSASRFVKAAWLRQNLPSEGSLSEKETVPHVFRLLSAVAPLKGSVLTADGQYHYTRYTCCIDAQDGTYYYTTHENPAISAVSLSSVDLSASYLRVVPLQPS